MCFDVFVGQDFAELTNLKGKEADARKLVQSKGLFLEGDKVLF